ncbi:MAG: DUF433 domain-containing protein, partial [Candidatus Omnitrophica bacterium]|nr:DUF433 domain-containing protein [Candidatus Omnitrophota bacterium]
LAAGESWEEILSGYPELSSDDMKAALLYAKESIEHTDILPLSATP